MSDEVMVILDLSEDAQTLLERQDVNLYEELQQEMPALRLEIRPDPEAPAGSRDAITTILAVATLVSSLTPLIIRILNQFTPPNRSRQWIVEETETRHPEGTTTIHRKRIRSSDEQRPWASLPYPNSQPTTSPGQTMTPPSAKDSQQ